MPWQRQKKWPAGQKFPPFLVDAQREFNLQFFSSALGPRFLQLNTLIGEDFQHRFHNFHYLSCAWKPGGSSKSLPTKKGSPSLQIVQAPPSYRDFFAAGEGSCYFGCKKNRVLFGSQVLCYLGSMIVYFSINVTHPISIYAVCFLTQ